MSVVITNNDLHNGSDSTGVIRDVIRAKELVTSLPRVVQVSAT